MGCVRVLIERKGRECTFVKVHGITSARGGKTREDTEIGDKRAVILIGMGA